MKHTKRPQSDYITSFCWLTSAEKELIKMKNTLSIDISQIPDFRREELAKGALALTEQVFSMPGAEERYQAWLKERRAKQKRTARAAR